MSSENNKTSGCKELHLFPVISTWLILLLFANPVIAQEGSTKQEYLQKIYKKMEIKRKLIKESQGRLHYEKYRLSVMNNREQDMSTQLKKTEHSLFGVEESIRTIKDRRCKVENEIAALKEDLAQLQEQLIKKQQYLQRRLKNMYIQDETSYLSVILESESFSDFVNRVDFFQRIVKADMGLIDEVKRERAKLKEEKKKQESLENELVGLEHDYRKKQSYFGELRSERKGLLDQVSRSRDQIANNVYEMEALTRELETQLQSMIRDAQAVNQNSTTSRPIVSERSFIWPVKGYISSPYGYRLHPIRGRVIFHSGIDLAAGYGLPIRATASGIVIYSGWYGGYGNTVVIDHGNGCSSLYAHCSALYVSLNQKVSQGSAIAAVGSTGLSTGPHLHFEIRQNGNPVDPRSKL